MKNLKQNGINTSQNRFDALDQLIFEENLSIIAVDIHIDTDLMWIILNTKAILHQKISNYARLENASENELKQYELIAGGKGIHWPLLDEDLSLKGFFAGRNQTCCEKREK